MKISRIFCSKENEKLKCNTLIETNIQGEPKYRYEKSKEYIEIESFWNRTTLQEIEIKEIQRKRKGNTLFPREKERIINVRITSKKDEEKEERGEADKAAKQAINITVMTTTRLPYTDY